MRKIIKYVQESLWKILSCLKPKFSFAVVTRQEISRERVREILTRNYPMMVALAFLALPSLGFSSTTGEHFSGVYQFVHGAATGYLGRAIAITGGLIGLGMGASMGKALPAISGVVLAVFGSLGPSIIDTVFSSATI
jgi:conjugal transfer pilus assembly protein TraA